MSELLAAIMAGQKTLDKSAGNDIIKARNMLCAQAGRPIVKMITAQKKCKKIRLSQKQNYERKKFDELFDESS